MKKKALHIAAFTVLCTLLIPAFSAPILAAPAAGITPTGIPLDTLECEIGLFMDKHIGISSPAAAVAVVKDGEIIFSDAYGLADIENNIPADTNTVFEYGSISKLFVWTSVMQLAEQKRLDLDVDVRVYLPETFNKKWKTTYPITMRNIMNHSSGFGEFPFDLLLPDASAEVSLEAAILNAHPAQYFEPGTASAYSNYATALAGYVVECISGQAFFQYQKDNIFDVLDMSQTAGHPFWSDNISILDNKAQGYIGNMKGKFRNFGWSNIALYPAGSVSGTADDLAKLVIALMPVNGVASPLFESRDTLTTMLSPSYEGNTSGTAHGFLEFNSATAPAFGHLGNTPSFSAQLAFVPEERFGLIVLSNTNSEFEILYGLQDLLIGNKAVTATDQTMPSAYDVAGTYVSMRRAEKTPLEFVSYLSALKVNALDENTLQFKMGIFSGEYIQTAPYVFEITENASPVLHVMFPSLTFKVENGVPVQILTGNGLDMSALPSHRTTAHLVLSVTVLIAVAVYFPGSSIALIVTTIKRRKQGALSGRQPFRAQTALTLSGMVLLLNNVILLVTMVTNPVVHYSQVPLPLGIANYPIAALGAIALIFGVFNLRKAGKPQQIRFFITGILFAAFVLLLVYWNMFVLFM